MSGFPDIPEQFQGVVTADQFLRRWNAEAGKNLAEGMFPEQVHMDSEFAALFWKVAYADGYEWGAKDTTAAVTAKHTEMSAELSVLRDNQTDKATMQEQIAKAEDELRKAAEGLKAQRDQIIEMERERRAAITEIDRLFEQNQRLIGRSPIAWTTLVVEGVAHRARHRWLNGR